MITSIYLGIKNIYFNALSICFIYSDVFISHALIVYSPLSGPRCRSCVMCFAVSTAGEAGIVCSNVSSCCCLDFPAAQLGNFLYNYPHLVFHWRSWHTMLLCRGRWGGASARLVCLFVGSRVQWPPSLASYWPVAAGHHVVLLLLCETARSRQPPPLQ